jgi:5-formyltetrahydrofolate cyclo-ligase
MAAGMRKQEARALFRARRAALTPNEAAKLDDLLLISFQQAQIPYLQYVLNFYPAQDKAEPDTFLLMRYLQFINPNLIIAFPRVAENGGMKAVVPEAVDAFALNAFNIPEPVGDRVIDPLWLDLVLVPLLAFDARGQRAGYGKGYYDRYLSQCRPDCLKVGVSYFEAVPLLEDASEFDIPLDICITPHKVYVF